MGVYHYITVYRLAEEHLRRYLEQLFPYNTSEVDITIGGDDRYVVYVPQELTKVQLDYIDAHVRTGRRRGR